RYLVPILVHGLDLLQFHIRNSSYAMSSHGFPSIPVPELLEVDLQIIANPRTIRRFRLIAHRLTCGVYMVPTQQDNGPITMLNVEFQLRGTLHSLPGTVCFCV